MLPGQMLPEQMLRWQLASFKDGPRPLKFGQNRVRNRWDIPDNEQMSPGQILHGQMSMSRLQSV